MILIMRAGLRAGGLAGWLVEGLVGPHAVFAAGHGDLVTDVAERVGKIEPTTVEAFAAAHAGAFSPTVAPSAVG